MSPRPVSMTTPMCRFPRVSGDEPCESTTVANVGLFSPRERG